MSWCRCLVVAVMAGSAYRTLAQDTEVLKSRVLSAARRSTLNAGAMTNYKIEASIVTYDGAGNNPRSGVLEILQSATTSRVSITFPDAFSVSLATGGKAYSSARGTLPYFAAPIVRALQQPVEFNGFDTKVVSLKDLPEVTHADCIALEPSHESHVQGKNLPQYAVCLSNQDDLIRVVANGEQIFLRDEIVNFDGQQIARKLVLRLGGIRVAEIDVSSIEHGPTALFLQPSADMIEVKTSPVEIPATMMVGRIIKHENPKYPGIAKAARVQGVVILAAVINKSGQIQNLSVISSPDPLLSESSIKAVSKWTYQPYLLNGAPTEVNTTISVNFSLGLK